MSDFAYEIYASFRYFFTGKDPHKKQSHTRVVGSVASGVYDGYGAYHRAPSGGNSPSRRMTFGEAFGLEGEDSYAQPQQSQYHQHSSKEDVFAMVEPKNTVRGYREAGGAVEEKRAFAQSGTPQGSPQPGYAPRGAGIYEQRDGAASKASLGSQRQAEYPPRSQVPYSQQQPPQQYNQPSQRSQPPVARGTSRPDSDDVDLGYYESAYGGMDDSQTRGGAPARSQAPPRAQGSSQPPSSYGGAGGGRAPPSSFAAPQQPGEDGDRTRDSIDSYTAWTGAKAV